MGPIVGRAALACVLLLPCAASAIDEIATEEYVADLMATPRPAEPKSVETRSWAVLPEIGFGPDTGPLVGGKFTDRDVAGSGVTLDAEATQALERQQMLSLTAGTPHLVDDRFLALLEARFKLDPEREFFGLGNNNLGPDPVSTHEFQRTQAFFTVGWRLRESRRPRGGRDDAGRRDTPDARLARHLQGHPHRPRARQRLPVHAPRRRRRPALPALRRRACVRPARERRLHLRPPTRHPLLGARGPRRRRHSSRLLPASLPRHVARAPERRISLQAHAVRLPRLVARPSRRRGLRRSRPRLHRQRRAQARIPAERHHHPEFAPDRKSTRLNSSHPSISYAVFCLKKKKKKKTHSTTNTR